MYKGQPFANKILEKIEQDQLRKTHLNNIRRVRPNTGIPESRDAMHTLNPSKRQMQNENKCTQIERQNRLLLNKITNIMNKKRNASDGKINGSLNYSLRKKQFQSIEVENAKMLRRLQERKSDYQLHRFKKQWKKTKSVIRNIASHPIVIDEIAGKRKKKASSYELADLKKIASHNPEDFEVVKVRLINTKKFIITLRFTATKFVVIGDLRVDKELKVIQIDKNEALQFIQDNCNGDVNKLFDLIRYEQGQGCLYLVPRGVEPMNFRSTSDMGRRGGQKVIGKLRRPYLHQPLEQQECSNVEMLNRGDLIF